LAPGSIVASGNSDPYAAPSGVFACAGDDEWCVVTVRDDEDWARLCVVIGREDLVEDVDFAASAARVLNRDKVDHVLSQWLSNWSPAEAMNQLQAAGIPAGAMVRLPELLTDPQLTARNAYTEIEHSLLPAKLPAATRLVRFGTIADPELRQAPIAGEQTREIAESLLGLSSAEVDHLVRTSVLQPPADDRAHESRRSAEELV
jgi:crotonobetainyl-CoA:carnitine CoA-transferase CaiB-like acyl-CoA transferase